MEASAGDCKMLCEKVNGVPRGLKQDFVQFGMSFLHRVTHLNW